MKAIILTFVLFTAPIYIAFFQLEKVALIYPLNQLPLYVVNTSENSIPLYSAKQPRGKAIARLKSGDAFLYQYSGPNGRWWYGIKNNKEVLLKSDQREFAFKTGDTILPFSYIAWGITFLSLLFPFLYVMRGFMGFARSKRIDLFGKYKLHEEIALLNKEIAILEGEKENLKRQKIQALYDVGAAERLIDHIKRENDQLLIVQEKYQILTQRFKERDRRKDKERENRRQDARENVLYKEIAMLRAKFEQKKVEWLDKVSRESEKQTNVRVEQMQASYDRLYGSYIELKSDYDQIKEDGLVFDINFDSEKYEGMLKGRKFEIFFAVLRGLFSRFVAQEYGRDACRESFHSGALFGLRRIA